MNNEQAIKIDNKEYKHSELSEMTKNQILNIQVTDQEIQRLQIVLNITQTARNAYANELSSKLPKNEASAKKKKDIITIDEKRYALEDMSDNAKAQLSSLQQTNTRIQNLQNELAIAQTARNSYSQALTQELK